MMSSFKKHTERSGTQTLVRVPSCTTETYLRVRPAEMLQFSTANEERKQVFVPLLLFLFFQQLRQDLRYRHRPLFRLFHKGKEDHVSNGLLVGQEHH